MKKRYRRINYYPDFDGLDNFTFGIHRDNFTV